MKKAFYTVFSAIIIWVTGCQKGPYPYISLSDVKKTDSVAHPAVKNVAFIYKANVYYASDLTLPVTQITTDGSAAKFVKISHDHTKFAYLNFSNQIVVVNNKGIVITTLSQFTAVKSFDWTANDKTLYILNGDEMAYYGPALNLPEIDFYSFDDTDEQKVVSASVSVSGDFAYVVSGFDFTVGTKYELIIVPANKGKVIEYSNPDEAIYAMDYVSFSSNKQDLVLGYGPLDGGSGEQESMEFFTNLNAFPDVEYGGSISASPEYNSTSDYLLAGKLNDDKTISPAAIYLGAAPVFISASSPQTIVLTKYGAPGSVLYTDWKQ